MMKLETTLPLRMLNTQKKWLSLIQQCMLTTWWGIVPCTFRASLDQLPIPPKQVLRWKVLRGRSQQSTIPYRDVGNRSLSNFAGDFELLHSTFFRIKRLRISELILPWWHAITLTHRYMNKDKLESHVFHSTRTLKKRLLNIYIIRRRTAHVFYSLMSVLF